jgi:hypothetical protein
MPGLDDDGTSVGSFEVAPYKTLNPFLWQPVAAGVWKQHELFDGTYDVGDLLDVLEYLDTKAETARRARHAAEKE